MGKYSYYDPKEDVIFTDFSGVEFNPEIAGEVLIEVVEIAKGLPHQVFAVCNWQNAKLNQAFGYPEQVAEALHYLKGIVRYSVNDVYSTISIRSQAVKYHMQGIRSHIYASKEEALAAVRQLEQAALN